MFNLQGSEIIVLLLLALVFLGPEKLPDAIRRFARTYAELRKMGSGFQAEFRQAFDEPVREMRETATLLRDAADPTKVMAEAEAEAEAEAAGEAAAESGDADGSASDSHDDDADATAPHGALPPPTGPASMTLPTPAGEDEQP